MEMQETRGTPVLLVQAVQAVQGAVLLPEELTEEQEVRAA
jgi:hypothetical protein